MPALAASVLDAIEQSNYKCTVSEIVALTGLEVDLVEMEMATLLKDSGGVFETVDEDGDKTVLVNAFNFQEVRFVFPQNIRRALQQRSLAAWAAKFGSTVGAYIFAAFRISFGIFLLISLIIIGLAILAVILSNSKGNNRGGGLPMHIGPALGRRHGNLDCWTWYWLMGGNNPFFVAPIHQRRRQHTQRQREMLEQPEAQQQRRIVRGRILAPQEEEGALLGEDSENKPEMNFLDGIFSFLFGDAPPGPSLPERWAAIAAFIRQQSGIVAAEQLLPLFLPLPKVDISTSAAARATDTASTGQDGSTATSEGAGAIDIAALASSPIIQQSLMGVLARFGGKPVAIKTVNGAKKIILYDFPRLRDLGAMAGGDSAASSTFAVDVLGEERWRFSCASDSQQAWAFGLGALNLVGALWLRRQATILDLLPSEVASKALLGPTRVAARALRNKQFLERVLPFALKISWLLQLYALLFLVIPALRSIYIHLANNRIDSCNAQRQAVAKAVRKAASEHGSQLHEQLQCAQSHLTSQGI
jgi:hypothetical protein